MGQDLVSKRQNIAVNAVIYSTQLIDGLRGLLALKEERGKLGLDFQDSDFENREDLKHITAPMLGTLFDFVIPNVEKNYLDSENSGRNQQILLQVRR